MCVYGSMKNMKNMIIGLVAVVILAGAGYYWYTQNTVFTVDEGDSN